MIRNAKLLHAMGIRPKTVIHVGAHLAQDQPQYDLLRVPHVYWCEADHESCVQISRKYPLSTVIEGLFWSKKGEVIDFWIMEDRAQNSAFAPRKAKSVSSKRRILSTTLDAEFADVMLESPILLVIDVQGAEIEVLKGGTSLLSLVDYVVCEITAKSSISKFTVEQSKVESLLSKHLFISALKRVSHDQEYFDLLLIKGSILRIKKIQLIDSLFMHLRKMKNFLSGNKNR